MAAMSSIASQYAARRSAQCEATIKLMARVSAKKAAGKRASSRPVSATTRRERVESKEGAIVSAAYDMFATRGFAKSTMSDIASAAGVAEGTVYLYFNNKEALAGGVIARFYDQLTESAQSGVSNSKTTEEKLEFLAYHHLKSAIEGRRILELLLSIDRHIESRAGGPVYEMNKRYVAIFDSVVRDGVWRGDIDEGYSPWVLRDIFYGGLEYAMRTIEITGRKREVRNFSRQLVRLVMASAAAPDKTKPSEAEQRIERLADRLEGAAARIEGALPISFEGGAAKK